MATPADGRDLDSAKPVGDPKSSNDPAAVVHRIGTINDSGTDQESVDFGLPDSGDELDGSARSPMRPERLAIPIGLVIAVLMAALVGWLGFQTFQSHRAEQQRALYLAVARQGAIDLTTIDWHHADADIQRILGLATGSFHDDFSQRSQPFIDVVRKAQSTSVGTVTAAGLESSTASDAQALLAVTVQTASAAAPKQDVRAWRMRIGLHKIGDDVKVSNVEFVP